MDATPRLTREDKRTLGLSSLGGALEFYDFVIYVFYAKIISELFFPAGLSPFWAMLNTYGIFAAGYFFRPLGGVVAVLSRRAQPILGYAEYLRYFCRRLLLPSTWRCSHGALWRPHRAQASI